MAFDFPSAPSDGQIYTALNGAQFVWQSPVWMQVSAAQMKLTACDQNIVVNGAFQISQENGRVAGGNSYYLADQWIANCTANFTVAVQSVWGSALGSFYAAGQNGAVVASPAAADFCIPFYQPIEGLRAAPLRWGTPKAIPAVLNFKMAATKDGTYGCVVKSPTGDRSICFDLPYLITEGWKEFTFAIPAQTGGTFPIDTTNAALVVAFSHTLGSSMKAAAHGVWQNTNANGGPGMTVNSAVISTNMQIADVQLLPDPDGTGAAPKFVTPEIGDALEDCLRYYFKAGGTAIISGAYAAGASASAYQAFSLPAAMRATPTVSLAGFSNSNSGNATFSVADQFFWRGYCSSVAVGGFYSSFTWTASARM